MTTHDAINACFEGGGAVFLCLNVRRLLRDRSVKGVSLLTSAYWLCWSLFNCYFYSAVNTPASFWAGVAIVIVYTVWLALALHYARKPQPGALHVASGAELDRLGENLAAPRFVETDGDYRLRLLDCVLRGRP